MHMRSARRNEPPSLAIGTPATVCGPTTTIITAVVLGTASRSANGQDAAVAAERNGGTETSRTLGVSKVPRPAKCERRDVAASKIRAQLVPGLAPIRVLEHSDDSCGYIGPESILLVEIHVWQILNEPAALAPVVAVKLVPIRDLAESKEEGNAPRPTRRHDRTIA